MENILSDREAINYIKDRSQSGNPLFLFAGAGASAEAGVPTADAICQTVLEYFTREQSAAHPPPADPKAKAQELLNWSEVSERYVTCIGMRFKNKASRVAFFRDTLQGKRPSFSHHAMAMLLKDGYFRRTCITTNFDKLIESAFVYQGNSECQPIRIDDELMYLEDTPGRYFVLKLHGDYDTNNVKNTAEETTIISPQMRDKLGSMLQHAGMAVLGSAGNETSVWTLFNELTVGMAAPAILEHGLLWGVYMGPARNDDWSDDKVKQMLLDKIKVEKVVHPKIRQMIETGAKDNPYFCFFPVWGSGGMLLDLINRTGDNELIEEAEPYLDIELRLRKTFSKLDKGALEKHLQSLRSQRRNTLVPLPFNPADHTICNAAGNGFPVRIRLIYADILAMPLMRDDEFRGARRAVTSSEDTCISAGAGVAYSLAKEAGDYFLLHELAKFTDVPQRSIAVTSAGNLPAHFIFHAAALKIQNDGQYAVTADDVMETTLNAIRMAHALEVGALWVPLMGGGTGGLDENQSLTAILKAAVLPEVQAGKQLDLIVVIYKESKFSRDAVLVTAEQILGAAYTVTRFKP